MRTMLDGLFFGTATQGEAARLWRACRAVREQEDEDAQGHGQQATPRQGLPPGGAAGSRVCSAQAEQAVIGHRAGCAGVPRREACGRVRRGLRGVGRRPGPSLVARRPHSHSAGAAYKTPCEHAVGARADWQDSPNAPLQLKRNAADQGRLGCPIARVPKLAPEYGRQPWGSPATRLGI